jgi:signal transduction histidine kinase
VAADRELEIRWAAWLLRRNRRGLRVSLWIVTCLYPLFGILDYLIAPASWLWLLYGTRGAVLLATLVMFRVVRTRVFDRHPDAISAGYMLLISAGISLMTVFVGGLASPYYAGLALVIVATSVLYVWPARTIALAHAGIILSFVVLNLAASGSADLLSAISNQFFLVSTAVIAGAGQTLAYRFHREQIANQLLIERTNANLELAHDQLKQLDRYKSEFFANITHELKTPLTMMLAPLELMIDAELGRLSPAQRSTLVTVQRNGVKLLRLIADLLDLSKLEESRLRLRVGENDLVAHLRGLVTQAEPLARRKSIKLCFHAEHEGCLLWYDLERIERVFINLLSNAMKFTPAGGTIFVAVFDDGGAACVEVKDSGIGFPQASASRLFERFFQIDQSQTRRLGGAGIGLALAKELVELHGGTIAAESVPGQGATFRVRLLKNREHFPADVLDRRAFHVERSGGLRAADYGVSEWRVDDTDKFRLIELEQATEQRVVERDADERLRPHSVLVVEDTPDVIRVIRLALHHEFRVLAASDGAKGLDLARKHLPTLIITDLMMPELDGLELTSRVRRDPATRHIPIVMLTAKSALDDRVTGLEMGVNAYLAKPFSSKELLSTVHSLVQTSETAADSLMTHKLDSLQTLTGGLAHQIRNPLNYVKSAVASIQRDATRLVEASSERRPLATPAELELIETRMRRLFETAESGVRRIADTVDLMVRYSREGYTRKLQPYDVYAAIHDVLALLLPSTEFDVAVSTELGGDGVVECVPEEFNQVLTNLLENALHALPSDGTGAIRIRGCNQGHMLVLSIRDNGPGISGEDQLRIFTAFYTTKDVGRGLGLGLAISRRAVTSLGGTIHVMSELGAGAEFSIRVPRRAKPERTDTNRVFETNDPSRAMELEVMQ